MRTPPRVAVAALAAATVAGVGLAAVAPGSAFAATSRRSLAGSVPAWATAKAFEGAAATSGYVGFRVYLGWRNGSTAESLARQVSTPGSSSYGHFLSPAQFRQQFAPTQADVTTVAHWLRDSGFTIDYTPTNNHYVAAEGTVAQANAAFATTLGTYAYRGMTLRAPERALSVPASLPAVSGVVGLDDTAQLVRYDHVSSDATPSPGFRNATPLSAYFGEKTTDTTPVSPSDGPYIAAPDTTTGTTDHLTTPVSLPDFSGSPRPYATRGYTPTQIRSAYGLTDAQNGTGQTVAIIDAYASPTIVSDVNTYYSTAHQGRTDGFFPQLNATNFRQVVAPGTFRHPERGQKQDPQGWYGEETLDIEAVHGMAPQAKIVFVGTANNFQDLDAGLNHVVDNKLADIVTNSYGWPGEALPLGFVKPVHDILIQAAIEGIGVYFSSGDSSDETNADGTTPPQADFPASDPFVTAVGGTSLAVGADGSRLWEKGWATRKAKLRTDGTTLSWTTPAYLYGAGGGTSRIFAQPWYQSPSVTGGLENNHSTHPMRVVPDVSAIGDPNTGMLIGQTQQFPTGAAYDEYRIGGTSLSSPITAGIMADVQQLRGHEIGFANPLFYALAGQSSADGSGAFYDVTAADPGLSVVRIDYVNGVDATNGLLASVRVIDDEAGLTIHVRDGYDDITGIGSPGATFLGSLATATPLSH
jgi:subtilase family serine protease